MWPYSIVGIEIRNDTVGKRPRFEDGEGSGTKERVVFMYQSVSLPSGNVPAFSTLLVFVSRQIRHWSASGVSISV